MADLIGSFQINNRQSVAWLDEAALGVSDDGVLIVMMKKKGRRKRDDESILR